MALTDAPGNLVKFALLPGQGYDTVRVAPFTEDGEFAGLIADRLKEFRRIATRRDKTDRSFSAMVNLAAAA